VPLPRVNENEPAVTVNATLVLAVAVTLVCEVMALIDCETPSADSVVAVVAKLELPADPETPIAAATVNAPPPAAVIAYELPVLSATPPDDEPPTRYAPAPLPDD
jgi:hypothetical protein